MLHEPVKYHLRKQNRVVLCKLEEACLFLLVFLWSKLTHTFLVVLFPFIKHFQLCFCNFVLTPLLSYFCDFINTLTCTSSVSFCNFINLYLSGYIFAISLTCVSSLPCFLDFTNICLYDHVFAISLTCTYSVMFFRFIKIFLSIMFCDLLTCTFPSCVLVTCLV